MAKISLTKYLFGDFEVEDERLLGVYGPEPPDGEGLDDEALRRRIRNPIGAPPLRGLESGFEGFDCDWERLRMDSDYQHDGRNAERLARILRREANAFRERT